VCVYARDEYPSSDPRGCVIVAEAMQVISFGAWGVHFVVPPGEPSTFNPLKMVQSSKRDDPQRLSAGGDGQGR